MNVANVLGKNHSCKGTILPIEEGEKTHNSIGILAYKIIRKITFNMQAVFVVQSCHEI